MWKITFLAAPLVQLLVDRVRLTKPLEPVQQPSFSLDTIQQEMERLPQGARRLAVQLRLDMDPQWIWAVLTDYANLHRYIPNLTYSCQLWRRGNRVGLEQGDGWSERGGGNG